MTLLLKTVLTTSAGIHIDLLNPTAADIDFDVIAEHLSKANRYCGATPDCAYNVADHSIRCMHAACQATGNERLAAYLLCHDMHEAYLGDDTTPKKRALAAICASFGALAGTVEKAFAEITERFDVAIHAAAGLPWPPTESEVRQIKHFDRVLLATEWRDLMRCEPPYDFGVTPLPDPIVPSGWNFQKRALSMSCKIWLPCFAATETAP